MTDTAVGDQRRPLYACDVKLMPRRRTRRPGAGHGGEHSMSDSSSQAEASSGVDLVDELVRLSEPCGAECRLKTGELANG